nr:MAG TPA: hypothetical protein [Caudoviricetes sp.]
MASLQLTSSLFVSLWKIANKLHPCYPNNRLHGCFCTL